MERHTEARSPKPQKGTAIDARTASSVLGRLLSRFMMGHHGSTILLVDHSGSATPREGEGGTSASIQSHQLFRSKWLDITLQRLDLATPAPQLHCHTRSSITAVLSGHYTESYLDGDMAELSRRVRWFSRNTPHRYHRLIEAPAHTWLLVVSGPWRQHRQFLGEIQDGQCCSYTPSAPHREYSETPPPELDELEAAVSKIVV